MAKIKHIAISTQDPDAACKFYTETMGLKVVGRSTAQVRPGSSSATATSTSRY